MAIPAIGAYEWRQISMWDFAPRRCVEKFVREGPHIFHYYLVRCKEHVSACHYKIEVVESLEGVPEDVLRIKAGDTIRERSFP